MTTRVLTKSVTFFGQPVVLACDGDCDKAWGINNRPRTVADGEFCADATLGTAPRDPGTYEGADAKPTQRPMTGEAMNRWCARECERCAHLKPGELVTLPSFAPTDPNTGARPMIYPGEFHWRFGIYFKREADGAVRLRVEHSNPTMLPVNVSIPPLEWASIVAHVAHVPPGDDAALYSRACELHGATGQSAERGLEEQRDA